ncbi:MAG: R3H domain-containing nucleic acid-binding protein [Actinomycetaceae bacterium]|nr:R3H domain-containing nucleic acid-binding protein [Actinomycetaceae bacterium]
MSDAIIEEETEQGLSKMERLEAEGEYAADYLEELLDITDFDGDIEIDIENGRALVEIISEDNANTRLNKLVGDNGEVLDALQELTRLAVHAKTGERSRLMLDIAEYRKNQKVILRAIAEEAIIKVQQSGEPVRLQPMNAFERKACHDVIDAAGLVSESEGIEPNRRIVIRLADDELDQDTQDIDGQDEE